MAWLRNRHFPANFDPTFVPTFPVTLIPDHPLVNGLCGLYLSADGTDYSPYGNNGVATSRFPGTVTLGQDGTLMSFNGTNQAFVGGGKGLNTSFATISVWVYGTAGSSIYPLSIGTSTNYAMYFQMTFGAQAQLGCFTSTSNTVSSVAAVPSGVLTHLCGTFSSSSNLLQCYVNGVPTASTTTAGTLRAVSNILVSGLYSSSTLFYYSQYLASASVYNRALTAGEVYALYREPYDMLAPVARRTYTKSQLVSDFLSISATVPKPEASASVLTALKLAITATPPKPHASFALEKADSLHVTATTAAPHASISLKMENTVAANATTLPPVTKIGLFTGDAALVQVVAPKPSASLFVTNSLGAKISATTQSPHALVEMLGADRVSIAGKTVSPTAHLALTATLGVVVAAKTVAPIAHVNILEAERESIRATTKLPIAHFNAAKGESLSIAAVLPVPPSSTFAVVKQGETSSLTATTRAPIALVMMSEGKVATIAITAPPPKGHFVLEQDIALGVASAPRPITDIQISVGDDLTLVATTLQPTARISSDTTTSIVINAILPMPGVSADASTLQLSSHTFFGVANLGNISPKILLDTSSVPAPSVGTILGGPSNTGLLVSSFARPIPGHPVMVYQVPQVVQVVYPSSSI